MIPPHSPSETSLSAALHTTNYRTLFQLSNGQAAKTLWSTIDPTELTTLLNNPATNAHTAFLAAELAATFDASIWKAADPSRLAHAYGEALAHDFVGMANPWGLPKKIGVLGGRLLDLEEAAVPSLRQCLSVDTAITYAGSEEASTGNAYAFRVKDIAAYYLALIGGYAFHISKDPVARDHEIERLKQQW